MCEREREGGIEKLHALNVCVWVTEEKTGIRKAKRVRVSMLMRVCPYAGVHKYCVCERVSVHVKLRSSVVM